MMRGDDGARSMVGEFQHWLDRMGEAVLSGDFDTYCAGVSLPFTLVTRATSLAVGTLDELRSGFDDFRDMLRTQGATEMIRLAHGVFEVGDGLVTGNYETHILKRGARIFPPFSSTAILRRGETGWEAAAICNAMTNSRWPIGLPRIAVDGESGA